MLGDETGPQQPICIACAVPRRDNNDRLIRDANGVPVYHCESCIARWVDRWCECFACPWLKEDNDVE